METEVGYPLREEVRSGELLQLAIFSNYTTKLRPSNVMRLARI
ncbi:Uncharacterised protein [Prescottella equi]|nr:Uncharacterised protein [Prescottella equi]